MDKSINFIKNNSIHFRILLIFYYLSIKKDIAHDLNKLERLRSWHSCSSRYRRPSEHSTASSRLLQYARNGQISETIRLLDVEGWESQITGRYIHSGILLKDTQLYLYTVYPNMYFSVLYNFWGIPTVYMYSILAFLNSLYCLWVMLRPSISFFYYSNWTKTHTCLGKFKTKWIKW